MPADKPGWGGTRDGAGTKEGPSVTTTERNGLVRRVANMEAQIADRDRLDASGQKTPKAISVMRLRMNFHMWQVSIIQKKAAGPDGKMIREYTPTEKADMERRLQLADD